MPNKEKKENGLLCDIGAIIGSTFTAMFLESTEEVAQEAVKQHIERKKNNNKNK